MIFDQDENEVDNHFQRVNILTFTLSGMYYIFCHTKIIECKILILSKTQYSVEELDCVFTEKELRRAVFSQNDKKSPGIYSISSEIIKTSYDFISTFLLQLYNGMFHTAEYPCSWAKVSLRRFSKRVM